MGEDGTWVDVAPFHEPKKGRGRKRKDRFEAGVGLTGYERGTGDEVVRDPSLKRPGEKKPVARDLFD